MILSTNSTPTVSCSSGRRMSLQIIDDLSTSGSLNIKILNVASYDTIFYTLFSKIESLNWMIFNDS